MIKLSILIPTYNGEYYIAKCLDSILKQSFPKEEYEIICLDDNSIDNTCLIVSEYVRKYPNVFVYRNEENCRVASNFNRLLALANGEYIWHVDQDDIIVDGALRRIMDDNLYERNLDIILFNYHRVREDETIINSPCVFENAEVTSGVNFIRQQFRSRDYCQYLLGYDWRSVSRRSIWESNRIRCIEGINYEDTIIMLKALMYSERASSISDYLYKYRINEGSITYNQNFVKSGRLIYEYAFEVGQEVESCYNEMNAFCPDLAKKLYAHLINRYNNFNFDLIRTSIPAKNEFYENINENIEFVNMKKRYLNWKSQLLLLPHLGFQLSVICQYLYRLKKAVI